MSIVYTWTGQHLNNMLVQSNINTSIKYKLYSVRLGLMNCIGSVFLIYMLTELEKNIFLMDIIHQYFSDICYRLIE